jgi:hypothetical protein
VEGFNSDSIWQQVLRDKYLHNATLVNWIRRPSHFSNSCFEDLVESHSRAPSINHWLSWCPGTGHLINIGRDRILGIGDNSFLNEELLTLLNQKQITTLAQASLSRDPFTFAEVWRSSTDLELTGELGKEWDNYTRH